MSPQDRQFIEKKFGELMAEVLAIKRGVYGEPINKTPGALDRIANLELAWRGFTKLKSKIVWVTVGGMFVAGLVVEGIKIWWEWKH